MSDRPDPADRYKNYTVMIVDDQEAVRDSVRLMLRALGFGAITEAANGEAAKEQFLTRVPDLIICDINMTPTNGFAFVKWVRLKNSGSLRTPVLFLTSHTEREVVMKAKDLGIDGFLVKPVVSADLTLRVERAMRIYR
mgnify:CR=1 FL=1